MPVVRVPSARVLGGPLVRLPPRDDGVLDATRLDLGSSEDLFLAALEELGLVTSQPALNEP